VRTRLVDGFTLIEVLVAALLLAVGIVGAAGVQVAALRTRHATGLMSGGVQLAAALAERMRANSAQMGAGDGANPYLQLRYDAAADGAPAQNGASCFGGAACSSADMAAFDLYEIKQSLYADFPGGRVAVCRDAAVWAGGARGGLTWECAGAAGAPIVIKLGWRDRRADPRAPARPAVALMVAGAFP
jgi:type IV pilus assembly protein PilV